MIAKVASDALGPWAKVSPGTLYPILAKLVREGGDAPTSRRDPRTYAITEIGRARFRELMLDTASNPGDYQRRFHLKVPTLEFLAAAARRQLFEHYGDYCRTAIRYLEKEARLLVEYGPNSGAISAVGITATVGLLTHQADQWRAELAWAERLRAQHDRPPTTTADLVGKTDNTPSIEPTGERGT